MKLSSPSLWILLLCAAGVPSPALAEAAKDKTAELLEKVVAYHIKNLNDSDPDIRQESCDMLAALNVKEAVAPLIEVLKPSRNERINVMLHAHGALVKITGRSFGYKNYDEWTEWKDHADAFTAKFSIEPRPEMPWKKDIYPRGNMAPGLWLFDQAEYCDAIERFKEVMAADDSNPEPYLHIGRCYARLGRVDDAESYFKQALQRDKDGGRWDLRWQIGTEYMRFADWNKALKYLNEAEVTAKEKRHEEAAALICHDLATTEEHLGKFTDAWHHLAEIRMLGYDPNPDLFKKVQQDLIDAGRDPVRNQK